ncbi:Palmitoyltransferase zdhhc15 [Perkinsus chesapeaki]|uniref:Palmitoyltransferase n=1 Tax=Perkinsus chesapeaki TaxID=330153 RepID=A0A7J6MHY6_PERCH|nr:Palmitoyltransferase zdhhc15 [Perkinsus chesapeaki]
MPDNPTLPALLPPPHREPAKFLPVIFVCSIITTLWAIYNFVHIVPMLQLDRPAVVHQDLAQRGWIELIIFNSLSAMLLLCYTLCVVIHPGEIPDSEEWLYDGEEEEGESSVLLDSGGAALPGSVEVCKVVGKIVRVRYAREEENWGEKALQMVWQVQTGPMSSLQGLQALCKVLKMDHHCPWIYNCVGFRNHKYFFLLLFYATLTAHFMWITVIESTRRAVDEEEPLGRVFLLMFGTILSCLFGLLLTAFFAFHIWLAFKAMTTIEYCEKSSKKLDFTGSVYHRGCYGDFIAVVGPNPLFWLLPIAYGRGDGMTFATEGCVKRDSSSVGNEVAREDKVDPSMVTLHDQGTSDTTQSKEVQQGGEGDSPEATTRV